MALPDVVDRLLPDEVKNVPRPVEERIKRGKDRMENARSERKECYEFVRNKQYVYRSADNLLTSQSTTRDPSGTGKPAHRVRQTRNLIRDIVAQEISASTQRVPGYEVNPSTSEPDDISAAQIATKVAYFGYDKWKIRKVTVDAVYHAIVGDGGYVWPHWDSTVGPYIETEDGAVGEGEVKLRVFGGNEVFWEPDLKFEESPWHGIQQARSIDSVQEMEGFFGTKINPDAEGNNKLCMVTEYLERPTAKSPNGRWLTIVNGKQVVPERPFPCSDHEGNILDEPVLHKLSYFPDPDSDRDMGLVRDLLDAQRTYNDCTNKLLEWKNLALNPQPVVQNGELLAPLTDEPGAVIHVRGSNVPPSWRPVPPVPSELSKIKDEAKEDMARIAAQNDIPGQVESGRGIAALIEKDQSRRAEFLSNLADFHSRLMRHCLYLVQRHYTEPRLLKIRGRFGPTTLSSFLGSALMGQVDVTVLPGSLEPRSRAVTEQRVLAYSDRGWISPEAAMAAINGGSAEALVDSYELDVARANQIVQKIMDGPDALFDQPPRPALPEEQFMDEETGMPVMEVPGWMPRPFDNVLIHKAVLEDFLKTPDYDMLEDAAKEAAHVYYQALSMLEAKQRAEAEQRRLEQAQNLGMDNASKEQKAPPMPDQPQLPGNN